jgi:hypothetical protein
MWLQTGWRGPVTVVVAPDGVVAHDAVGYADVAAKQPLTPDALFLDRSDDQAVHGGRADDAGGRRQS